MTSRREMCEKRSQQAHKAFANHQIIKEDREAGRWLLGPNGETGNCWCEVACLEPTKLYVGGDIGPLIFAYGPKNPVARVLWLSRERSDADPVPMPDDYFMEKAIIGMCGDAMIREWVNEIARADLADLVEDEEDQGVAEDMRDEIDAAIGMEDRTEVYELLNRYGHWEACQYFGMFATTRVFQSFAAIHRLGILLRATL